MAEQSHKNVAYETFRNNSLGLIYFLATLSLCYFPIYYILDNGYNSVLNHHSDFASLKFFLAIIPALLFTGHTAIHIGLRNFFNRKFIFVSIFGLGFFTVQVSLAIKILVPIIVFNSLLISCALIFGYAVYKSKIWLKHNNVILWAIISFSFVQAVISILQFYFQQSLGLGLLGESILNKDLYGVAKIMIGDEAIIRGYGLFPHPNILGFMLFPGLISIWYLLNKNLQKLTRLILSMLCLVTTFGLFISFSRAALLATGVGFLYIGVLYLKKLGFSKAFSNSWVFIASVLVSIAILAPYLLVRSNFADQAMHERSVLLSYGVKIALNKWFLGTGAGTNMFHMEQNLVQIFEPWLIQPIHNFFVLSWSELGIIGLFFGFIVLYGLYRILRKSLSNIYHQLGKIDYTDIVAGLILGIVILFFFDHYFYTYWPTQLILWMFLAVGYGLLNHDNNENEYNVC